MTKQENMIRITAIENALKELPKGRLVYKNIKGRQQP